MATKHQSREQSAHPKPYVPPSQLSAPEAPPGTVHRWLRVLLDGKDDTKRISMARRDGWEFVRAEEYADDPTLPVHMEGRFAGCIGVGDIVLGRNSEEHQQAYADYYANLTQRQMTVVDQSLFKENRPGYSMQIQAPERRASVTRGGSRQILVEDE